MKRLLLLLLLILLLPRCKEPAYMKDYWYIPKEQMDRRPWRSSLPETIPPERIIHQ